MPVRPVSVPRRPLKTSLQVWWKNWATATGFEVAVAWRIAAVAAGKVIPASCRTRGFLKSDGLMVIQKAERAIKPFISDRLFTFCAKDSGTCIPIVRMLQGVESLGCNQ